MFNITLEKIECSSKQPVKSATLPELTVIFLGWINESRNRGLA